jgi:aspartyl-tRNA(Asn)/glutamyl-tRNA(Gln) amidotransferase subunit A
MEERDLPFLTLAEAAREIRAGRLSPVELTRAVLERVQALNDTVNAYITITAESAMQEAANAERDILHDGYRGPLHGIPIALKDLFDTQGVRTTGGSKILADRVPDADCTVVANLRRAGAVLLGKLNLHEFAFGVTSVNPHYGPARNPWDTKRITGGSSGGSGAATAAGMCFASLGSDTGGSVRIPACLCGIVGLKPTYGLVSRRGVLPLSWSLDHVGPMARTVEDTALMLNVIAGHDSEDPGSLVAPAQDYTHGLSEGLDGVRVGVLGGDYVLALDPEVEGAMAQALELMEALGALVERDVTIPLAEYASAANTTIISAEAATIHARYLNSQPQAYGDDVYQRLTLGRLIPATDYINAQQARRHIHRQVLEALEGFDLLALPMMPVPAPRIDEASVQLDGNSVDVRSALTRYTGLFNLSGLPAISVPCGFTSQGLPVGIQLVGRPLAEAILLRAAHAYEQAAGWWSRRPPLD